jgi:hypothetical protein
MAEESLKIVLTADNKQAIAAMKQTVTSLNEVDSAANKTGGKVVAMGKDFTGLSRVIQDLPYGFNAIANNLTNILPAAGALGLGISALVAGLQFAQLGFGNWTRGLETTKEKLKETEQENEKFRQSLAKEKAQLDILFATATNDNISRQARLKAVKDLRNEYGGYLKNYSDEDILVGRAAEAHKKLADAIMQTAKAQALRDAVQKDYDALIKLDQDLADAKRNKEQADREMLAFSKGRYQEDIQAQEKLLKEETRIANERYRIQQEINRKINSISDLAVAPFGGGDGDKEKKGKPWKAINQWQMTTTINPFEKEADSIKKNSDAFNKYVENVRLGTEANRAYSAVARENYLLNVANAEVTALATQYTDMAMNSINGLVNAMINGQNVGQALGDMFKRLAADIALAAAKALIFETLLSVLMPAKAGKAAFGAGKTVAKLMGFSEGGTVSGPRSGYPVMLHGTEHIVRPDQMRSIIASASQMGGGNSRVVVEGVVRGNDIWLSQSRTNTFRALTT